MAGLRARARVFATRGQGRQLNKRIEKLEAELHETRRVNRRLSEILDEVEMQDLRRLNRRLAELVDVVQEILVPAANRDDEQIRRRLDEYSKRL